MATLTLTPDQAYEENVRYKTIVSEFESGYEQRRQKWANPLRKFRLVYTARTAADYNTMLTFFNARKGSYDSFVWNNYNDSTNYNVRFVSDDISVRQRAYDVFDFEVELQEVR